MNTVDLSSKIARNAHLICAWADDFFGAGGAVGDLDEEQLDFLSKLADSLAAVVDEQDLEVYEEERDERFPVGYCEIEYSEMESEEAVRGCAFDDMNYLRYFER